MGVAPLQHEGMASVPRGRSVNPTAIDDELEPSESESQWEWEYHETETEVRKHVAHCPSRRP